MAAPSFPDLLSSPVDPQTMPQPIIHAFPSRLSGTTTYIVVDPVTEEAAIINPILDLDPFTNAISTKSADRLLKFINDEGLTIKFILETTLHRDRISACRYVQLTLKHIGDGVIPKVCIGENSFCTCGDDSDPDSSSPSSQASPQTPQPQSQSSHHQHSRNPSTSNSSSSPSRSTTAPSPASAFDHLFADAEPIRIGNMVARCSHLDDHAGVVYTVAQHAFSSTTLSRTDGKHVLQGGVVNHPEPPPDKANTNGGHVSSRATASIDEVLGSAEKLSLGARASSSSGGTDGSGERGGGGGSDKDQQPAEEEKVVAVRVSPMLAFYAEQVNTRGGRIPRKINLPGAAHGRKGSVSNSSPLAGGEGGSRLEDGSSGGRAKGKEREGGDPGRRRTSVNGPGQPVPLKIPRKLSVIMC